MSDMGGDEVRDLREDVQEVNCKVSELILEFRTFRAAHDERDGTQTRKIEAISEAVFGSKSMPGLVAEVRTINSHFSTFKWVAATISAPAVIYAAAKLLNVIVA
jgi:hypothetical protein